MPQNDSIKRQFRMLMLLGSLCAPAFAQEANSKGAILQRLEAKFVPTQTTDDKSDITTAGSILTLRKDNLMTVGLSSGSICPNSYKEGKISQSMIAKVTCGKAMSVTGQAKRKIFLAGQKLWVTNIAVNDGSIVFDLYTDAYGGERYRATLTFSFGKGALPAPAGVESVISEVFSADPPPQPAAAEQAAVPSGTPPGRAGARKLGALSVNQPAAVPQTPAPAAPLPNPAPPPAAVEGPLPQIDAPPPPPADPQTIQKGQTQNQVLASFGKPEKIVKLGAKEIYYYKDLKVTFVENKVADVQ